MSDNESMRDITFTEELFKDMYQEAMPLVEKHYDEIAHYQDIPLDPDVEMYKSMEDIGILKVFTARKAGNLVGYAVFIVKPNPHYKTSMQAIQDVIFIHPRYRGFGRKFIDWIDQTIHKNYQTDVHYQHVKAAHDFGKMLETLDYKLIDYIYGRRMT